MMKKYQIKLTESATADLKEIVQYISDQLREPETAKRQIQRLKDAISSLSETPQRHTVVSDSYLALRGIRKLLIDHYIIFYIINDDANVTIVRVLYSKRNWQHLL